MGFVLNRSPVPDPLKPPSPFREHRPLVFWRLVEVAAPFEHADVERDAEVVIWTARQWQAELSEGERERLSLFGTEVERDLFWILRSFASHANSKGAMNFPFPIEHVGNRSGCRFNMSVSCGGVSLIAVLLCKAKLRERIVARLGFAGVYR
jgi:hypothetical protein